MFKKKKHRNYVLAYTFLCLFFISPKSLHAIDFCPGSDLIDSSQLESSLGVSPYLRYFSTSDKKLSLPAILDNLTSVSFKSTDGSIPNYGKTDLQYWFCFRIKNSSHQYRHLTAYIKYPLLDNVNFFDLTSDGKITQKIQGRAFPISQRESIYRGFSHVIDLTPEEIRTIYIRVETQSSMSVPIYLTNERDFDTFVSFDYLFQGLYFGIVGVMALYNLFVYSLVKDKAYIFYVIYLFFGSILFQLSLNGLIPIFLLPDSPELVALSHNSLYYLFLFFSFPLFITFLNLKENARIAYRILMTLMLIPLIGILLLPFFPYRVMNQLGDLFSFVVIFIFLFTSYYAAFIVRYRPAYYFFIAFLCVIIGGIATLLKYMGILPVNSFTDNAFQISMSIEVLLMAFGLGDRIALVRKEKEQIQFRAEINKQKLNAFQKELLLAQKLQESTLPAKLPNHPGIKILTGYLPASLVGGDFYDIVKLNDNDISCLIADVTGHGVPAAIEAAMLKIAYSQGLRFASSPGLILEKINRSLVGSYKNQLLTASAFYLNLETKVLTVANAGHPPLYLLRENSRYIESIRPPGKLIGYSRDLAYPEVEYSLNVNDRILMYTDGLWEIWERDISGDKSLDDGSGESNLMNWLHENWDLTMEEMIQAMKTFIAKQSSKIPPDDDITYILFKIT